MVSSPDFFPPRLLSSPKPRSTGLTHVLDRLGPLEDGFLKTLAPYADIVKIGWGLPLLLSQESLRRRIQRYHEVGVPVCTGGTLLEYAIVHQKEDSAIRQARSLGFDMMEISEGIIDLTPPQMESLSAKIRSRDLDVLIEVGKKNPHVQYSLRETLERIGHARTLKPRKVILESRETGRGVGIYDSEGGIKWDWVHAILAAYPQDELIFEAPLEGQQVGLIVDLGPDVNLGNVAFESVLPLASQRQGLRGDTFGLTRHEGGIEGSPAAKFVYYLLESHHSLDQSDLVRISRLARRTVQSALDELKRQGRITEVVSLRDARKREYRLQ